jgi:hypothetical protein
VGPPPSRRGGGRVRRGGARVRRGATSLAASARCSGRVRRLAVLLESVWGKTSSDECLAVKKNQNLPSYFLSRWIHHGDPKSARQSRCDLPTASHPIWIASHQPDAYAADVTKLSLSVSRNKTVGRRPGWYRARPAGRGPKRHKTNNIISKQNFDHENTFGFSGVGCFLPLVLLLRGRALRLRRQ